MKKLVLLIGLVAFSLTGFAQSKGEMYLLLTGNASFGTLKRENYSGYQTIEYDQPANTSVGLDVGFGFFAADNFRLELCVGASYIQEPRDKQSDQWLYGKVFGVNLYPSLAYYVQLADRLYYVPEIGGSFTFGTAKYDVSTSVAEKYDYGVMGAYAKFFALEFRVSPKFALGVNVGQAYYQRVKVSDPVTGVYSARNQLMFDVNSLGVNAMFYL